MKKTKYITVILLLIISCKQSNDRNNMFPISEKIERNISINKATHIDSIYLNCDKFSTEGNLLINDEKIYLFDYISCLLYEFDKGCKLLEAKIGKGQSNSEIAIGSAYASAF